MNIMAAFNTVEMFSPSGSECFHRNCKGVFKKTSYMWGKRLHHTVDYAYKCTHCEEVVFDRQRESYLRLNSVSKPKRGIK